jgi:hypothetical protein
MRNLPSMLKKETRKRVSRWGGVGEEQERMHQGVYKGERMVVTCGSKTDVTRPAGG